MKVFLFTPTCHYGGLDVNAASILRQDYDGEMLWAIGDDLFDERSKVVARKCDRLGIPTIHFKPAKRKPGYRRNLAAAYNEAIEFALHWNADVFVSFQDYFWLPPHTVTQTVEDIIALGHSHTLTGLASLYLDPGPEMVEDLEGLWTIFGQDYTGEPQIEGWHDVREAQCPPDKISPCSPVMWEANYSAFPMTVARDGCRYDESYDKNVAFENQDFALTCWVKCEAFPHIDPRIHVKGLPHKSYWPEKEKEDIPYSQKGMEAHLAKWQPIVGAESGLV